MLQLFVVLGLAALIVGSPNIDPAVAQTSAGTVQKKYLPKADPVADLEKAKLAAAAQNRKILLVVGGDWCADCIILDRFLQRSKDVQAEFDKAFVTAKIYLGPENLNPDFLSKYPDIEWVPQFFVLDAKGKLLKAQDTRELSANHFFDREKMLAFAKRWQSK